MSNAAIHKKGMKVRKEVLGSEREAERMGQEDAFSMPLRDFTTRYVWGEIWSRKGLPRKTRCLLNIGMLTALRCESELKSHVRGALLNGATKVEIREVLLQAAVYCGVPAMRGALRVVKKVFAEEKK
jgi:4-carboxymuconolactone decarboxylase